MIKKCLVFQYYSCGITAAHCGNAYVGTAGGASGNCQATGCTAGNCCSRFGLYVVIISLILISFSLL